MKFGLVGTGHWARAVHGPALSAAPSADLVGVWGRNRESVQLVASELGVPAYASLDSLLHDIDAVSFAVSPLIQAELALGAAEAGKHLLLEKPVSTSVTEACRLADRVYRNSLSSIVFFTARFKLDQATWFERACRSQWSRAEGIWRSSALSQPSSPYLTSQWRKERGALWDIGPHALSLILPIMGPVTNIESEHIGRGSARLLLSHREGAQSVIDLCFDEHGRNDKTELSLFADNSTSTMPQSSSSAIEAMVNAIESLARVAQSDAAAPGPACDIEFGVEVVQILDQADKKMRELNAKNDSTVW